MHIHAWKILDDVLVQTGHVLFNFYMMSRMLIVGDKKLNALISDQKSQERSRTALRSRKIKNSCIVDSRAKRKIESAFLIH